MKKPNKKYYLSVEGKVEKYYFQWLFEEINKNEQSFYNLNHFIMVRDSPIKFSKRLTTQSSVLAFHITDVESTSEEHRIGFERELDEMDKVTKTSRPKIFKYQLGYSNISFELWMILHKMNCFAPANQCSDYTPLLNRAFATKFESESEFKREKEIEKVLNSLSLSDVIDAIKRAKKIMKQNEINGYKELEYKKQFYYRENPSLSVHEIIELILKDVGIL